MNGALQRLLPIASIPERDAIARYLAAISLRPPRTASLKRDLLLFWLGPYLQHLRLLYPSFLVVRRLTPLCTKGPKQRSTGANVRSARTGASLHNLKEDNLARSAPSKGGADACQANPDGVCFFLSLAVCIRRPVGLSLRLIVTRISMNKPNLRIDALENTHPGLSRGVAKGYREAAEVCLSRHHSPPTELALERHSLLQAIALWQQPDERTKRAWANEIDATEAGACCVALAALELTDGLVAVARAETRTGADYYVAPHGAVTEDLELATRLEVSGIDDSSAASVKTRLRQKLAQAARGRSSLPAIAAVVGFSSGQVAIADAVIP